MTIPLDQQIVDRLAALLGEIAIAGGYHTDAGAWVLVEQSHADIPDDAITLGIVDNAEKVADTSQHYTRRNGTLDVRIEVSVPAVIRPGGGSGQFQPARARARKAMADVRRAVAHRALKDFPSGITGIAIVGRSMPPLAEGSSHLLASVDFQFKFSESHLPKDL